MAATPQGPAFGRQPIIGQWSTKPLKVLKDVNKKESRIIWNLKMYEMNGIDKYVKLRGSEDGEWIVFLKAGMYKIDLSVSLWHEENQCHVRFRDSKNMKVKSICSTGMGYQDCCTSFIAKFKEGDQITVTYDGGRLNSHAADDALQGCSNILLIERFG